MLDLSHQNSQFCGLTALERNGAAGLTSSMSSCSSTAAAPSGCEIREMVFDDTGGHNFRKSEEPMVVFKIEIPQGLVLLRKVLR